MAPRTRRDILLGTLLGVTLAAGMAVLLDSMKDTVGSPGELTRRFGLTTLGVLSKWSRDEIAEGRLVLWEAPSSGFAEGFRHIRANLQFALASVEGNAILVTSPGPEEGKSTLVANLALAVAQSGKRVLIIDADLTRPNMHSLFDDVDREPGLTNFLADLGPDLNTITHPARADGVQVITSGPIPPNPAELLGAPRMAALLAQVRMDYDIVFVDSPPLLPVADATVLASQLDSVIIVADHSRTRLGSLRACMASLQKAEISIAGVIINKLKHRRFGYDYDYAYYHYYYSYKQNYGSQDSSHVDGRGLFGRAQERAKTVWSRLRRR